MEECGDEFKSSERWLFAFQWISVSLLFGQPHKLGCREHEYLIRLVMLFLIVVEREKPAKKQAKPGLPTMKFRPEGEKSRLERNFCLQMFNKTAESWFTFLCLCQTRCGWNWIENFVIAAENYVIDRKTYSTAFNEHESEGKVSNFFWKASLNRPIVSSLRFAPFQTERKCKFVQFRVSGYLPAIKINIKLFEGTARQLVI